MSMFMTVFSCKGLIFQWNCTITISLSLSLSLSLSHTLYNIVNVYGVRKTGHHDMHKPTEDHILPHF